MTEEEKKTLEDAVKVLHDIYLREVVRYNKMRICCNGDLADIIDMADMLQDLADSDL